MKIGSHVHIKWNTSACSRTKNRIREHGRDGFIVLSQPKSVRFAGGQWISLTSVSKLSSDGRGGKEEWIGWLPANEQIEEE